MVNIDVPLPALQKRQVPSERTILQVENNAANAELVKQIIAQRVDLKLLTVTNGLDGVEMARSLQPDIILMDMRMSCISGLDALLLLRESAQTSHIPVTILSSNAHLGEDKKCLAAGAFCYLTKPYKIKSLMASIDAALHFVAEGRDSRQLL